MTAQQMRPAIGGDVKLWWIMHVSIEQHDHHRWFTDAVLVHIITCGADDCPSPPL